MKKILFAAVLTAALFASCAAYSVYQANRSVPCRIVSPEIREAVNIITLRAVLHGGDAAILQAGESGRLTQICTQKGSRVETGTLLFTVLTASGREESVFAPCEGYISAVFLTEGVYLTSGIPVMTIIPTGAGEMKLSANAEEIYLSRLCEGQNVRVVFDAYPSMPVRAEVEEILPYATVSGGAAAYLWDQGSTTVELRIRMKDKTDGLIPGLSATAYVEIERIPDALLIPSAAILADDEGEYVFCVKDGRAFRRSVKSGLELDAYTQITDGLGPDDRIVESPNDSLQSGMRIRYAE